MATYFKLIFLSLVVIIGVGFSSHAHAAVVFDNLTGSSLDSFDQYCQANTDYINDTSCLGWFEVFGTSTSTVPFLAKGKLTAITLNVVVNPLFCPTSSSVPVILGIDDSNNVKHYGVANITGPDLIAQGHNFTKVKFTFSPSDTVDFDNSFLKSIFSTQGNCAFYFAETPADTMVPTSFLDGNFLVRHCKGIFCVFGEQQPYIDLDNDVMMIIESGGVSNPSGKTPVLIVPGVLGTDMFKTTDLLWVNINRMITDIGDEFMDPLRFNTNLISSDGIAIGDVVRNPNNLFDYSSSLISEFKNQGYTQGTSSSDSLFLFPYDWRYGVSGKYSDGTSVVDKLKQKIEDIRAQTGSNVVDVVAHSTGGLLVKQYVMSSPADNHIGKALFVGVPNTGAPKAIKTLLEGDSFGIPWLADSEMQKIAQNIPVVYDLMPSGKYYAEKNGPVKIFSGNFFVTGEKELNYDETNSYLSDSKGLNTQAITNAKNLHTTAYDNFDLRTTGVDLYAIDGCKTGTLSQIWDFQKTDGTHVRYDLGDDTPGDGTVPLESATNLPINEDHKFYSLNADHGKMPSQDGIRQQIVNIITGSQLSTQSSVLHKDLITQDISKCKLKGKAISVYSPLNIDIVDQDGNHSGLLADGVSVENNIPNADFEISGEHKFVYLPNDDGQTYTIKIKGTGNGTFTIKNEDIDSNHITQTEVFSNLPVTPDLTGQVNLGGSTTLTIQQTPTSPPVTVTPSSILNPEQSQDLTPPVTTATIAGTVGQVGFYRSNAAVTLSSFDPVVNNLPAQTSGVLKTVYSLDNTSYVSYVSPISVTAEGLHTITFFSTDKAGNNENPQTITFTIDKTAPEAVVQFNPNLKDIQFSGTDNISAIPKITVVDNVNDILLTDQAGNNTDIKLKEANRKISMQATILSLNYNGVLQDVSKNILAFVWKYDKNNNLTFLSQSVAAKKIYLITAVYDGKKTSLAGIDKTGILLKTITGLDLLKVATSKGDLVWVY